MHITRKAALIITRICLMIVRTSPNRHQEMGMIDGDQPINGGDVSDHLLIKVLNEVMLFGFFIDHILNWIQYLNIGEYVLIISMLAGCGLRLWAYHELGQLYTFNLGIRNDHQLVKSGPYAYIAHPGYMGQIICELSALLFLDVNWIIIVMWIIGLLDGIRRINIEEHMLERKFGQEWKNYIGSHPRFIPFFF